MAVSMTQGAVASGVCLGGNTSRAEPRMPGSALRRSGGRAALVLPGVSVQVRNPTFRRLFPEWVAKHEERQAAAAAAAAQQQQQQQQQQEEQQQQQELAGGGQAAPAEVAAPGAQGKPRRLTGPAALQQMLQQAEGREQQEGAQAEGRQWGTLMVGAVAVGATAVAVASLAAAASTAQGGAM